MSFWPRGATVDGPVTYGATEGPSRLTPVTFPGLFDLDDASESG
jgi:hypothetical protein